MHLGNLVLQQIIRLVNKWKVLKCVYLAALMYTVSLCVLGYGDCWLDTGEDMHPCEARRQ